MVQHVRILRRVRRGGASGQFDVLRARRTVEFATDAHIAALHGILQLAFDHHTRVDGEIVLHHTSEAAAVKRDVIPARGRVRNMTLDAIATKSAARHAPADDVVADIDMPRPVAEGFAVLHDASAAAAEQVKAAAVQIRHAAPHRAVLRVLQHQPPARARAMLRIVIAMAEAREGQPVDDHMLRAREQQSIRIRDRRPHRMTLRRQRIGRVNIQQAALLIVKAAHQRNLHLRRAHLRFQRAKRAALKHRLRLLLHFSHKNMPQPRRRLEPAQIHIPTQHHTPRPPRPNRDRRVRRARERRRDMLVIFAGHDRQRVTSLQCRHTLADRLEASRQRPKRNMRTLRS